ncbi:MAG: hypothetical protein K0S33_4279 [Bacteroidetes bacterium]|nr:hypothetical protein [Bacteroidota bacterium]
MEKIRLKAKMEKKAELAPRKRIAQMAIMPNTTPNTTSPAITHSKILITSEISFLTLECDAEIACPRDEVNELF